ncbi:MAG: HAD family hydrolase [Gemmatimonadota bacterium]
MLRAITLDYWDTIYSGASQPERVALRQEAVLRLAREFGCVVGRGDFEAIYHDSAVEFERVWRSGRGYRTHERLHWLLERLGVPRPDGCERVAATVQTIDDTVVAYPPSLLPGTAPAIAKLRTRFRLAIVSDTGFASGNAQNRLLSQDGLFDCFDATVYSMDIGHSKPRPEIFNAALQSLGISADEALHIGDNERTDVGGALSVGMRAIRLDAVREGGPSRAERIEKSLLEVVAHLLA